MEPIYTLDNTSGYSPQELLALNSAVYHAIASHLHDSIYDSGEGIIDIEGWKYDDPDDYKNLIERVQQRFTE